MCGSLTGEPADGSHGVGDVWSSTVEPADGSHCVTTSMAVVNSDGYQY